MAHYVFKAIEDIQQSEIDFQVGDTIGVGMGEYEIVKGDIMSHYEEEMEKYANQGRTWVSKPPKTEQNPSVSSPNHYLKLGYECIEIIASSLSKEAFKGYCMGNFLKYRFRMGDKDEMIQDFDKSKEYLMLYEKYNHLCTDAPF